MKIFTIGVVVVAATDAGLAAYTGVADDIIIPGIVIGMYVYPGTLMLR
jgi:hypothetical protein